MKFSYRPMPDLKYCLHIQHLSFISCPNNWTDLCFVRFDRFIERDLYSHSPYHDIYHWYKRKWHTHTHTGTNQHACGRQHDISCLLSQQRHTVHQRNHFARSAESWLMVAAAHKETLRLTRFSIRWPLPLCTCYANCYMTGSRINLARTLGCTKNAPSWTQWWQQRVKFSKEKEVFST